MLEDLTGEDLNGDGVVAPEVTRTDAEATAVEEKAIRIRFMPKVIRLPTHCMAMLGRPTV